MLWSINSVSHASFMLTGLYSLSPVLVPLPFDFGQHVIQSPQFRGNGIYLDPDSIRVCPRHAGPVQSLKAFPLPPDVGETPDGARQSRLGTVRLHGNFAGVKGVVLRSLQSLPKLVLQHFVPPLQFVDFGKEAAESQVERFQHMDVGAQVASQGAGHRARPGGDVADRTGRSIGEKQRVHVGEQPVIQLCLVWTQQQKLFVFISAYSHSHRTSFSLQCAGWEWMSGWWARDHHLLPRYTQHGPQIINPESPSWGGIIFLRSEWFDADRNKQQQQRFPSPSSQARPLLCQELLMLSGFI